MLLSDPHKIGPSDTPISSSPPPPPTPTPAAPFQAGLAWLAGQLRRGTACKHPDTHSGARGTWALGYLGTWVPRYLPYPKQPRKQCALARAGPAWTESDSAGQLDRLEQLTTPWRRLDALLASVPLCPTSSSTETLHEPTHVGVLAEPDSWCTHLVRTALLTLLPYCQTSSSLGQSARQSQA